MDLFDLKGKVAFVSGATGYLGKEMSLALADYGAHVFVNSRTMSKCEGLVGLITSKGGSASVACFDVTDPMAVDEFIDSGVLRSLDILINNSYAGAAGGVEFSKPEDYAKSYNSSVIASANLVSSFLPFLRSASSSNGYASIINIASMYGIVSPDQRIYDSMSVVNPPFYGAAKAALIQWSKYAACEFAKENIRVNSISPGPFPSEQVQENSIELVDKISQKVPMGRIGLSHEIAGPVLFLASKASSYVTGENLSVDGGWTCW